MSLIDISELLVDPDFATHFKILRTTGVWKGGRFILDSPEELSFYSTFQNNTGYLSDNYDNIPV